MEFKGLFAIKSVNELRQMSGDAHNSAMAIINKAKSENRNLSEDELKNYNEFNSQIDQLTIEIEQAQKLEAKRQEEARAYMHTVSNTKEKKELSQFSLTKYIREITLNQRPSGFELEMSQEATREAMEAGVGLKGFGVPRKVFTRDISIDSTQGGKTIATDTMGYIDALWEYLVFDKLGIDKWTNLKGNINIPKVTTKASAVFKTSQNEAATETSPVYDYVQLSPNVLAAFIDVDKQLLVQSSVEIENKLREMLMKAVAYKLEYEAINAVSSPWVGLLTAVTSNHSTVGASGGNPTWAIITAMEGLVNQQNALFGKLAWLASGKGMGKLKATAKDSGSGMFLAESQYNFSNGQAVHLMNGYPLHVSPAVLNNVTKATTATTLTHLVFGNWSDAILATWGPAYDLIVNPYTKAKEGMVELIIHTFCDFAVKEEKSFCKLSDMAST